MQYLFENTTKNGACYNDTIGRNQSRQIGRLVVKMVNTAGAIEGQRRGSPSGDECTIQRIEKYLLYQQL